MFRVLLGLVLIVIVIAAAAFFIDYRSAAPERDARPVGTVGTTGTTERDVDVGDARAAGADIAERVAVGANRAREFAADAALTAKIKSKMALDDIVAARRIDVDTVDGLVTLTGAVASEAERERAIELARETDGVISVADRLSVR